MTSISEKFDSLRAKKQCALIPFITAGDSDLETTVEALGILDECGADFIELGVPYSDPLADGPVIQAAATRAIKQGTRLNHVLEIAQSMTRKLRSPIILFTYYNPILNLGVEQFLNRVADAGIKGLFGDIKPNYWMAGIAMRDLFTRGALAGVAVGQPFIANQIGNSTQTNYEAFYNYPFSRNIQITPTIQLIDHAGNQGSNGTIFTGTLRTVFSF